MKYIFYFIFFVCSLVANAQSLNVKSLEQPKEDITARTAPRIDINDNPCALVKVRLALPNAEFKGQIAGDIEYKTSEYKVYMSEGSKKLNMVLPGYLPLDIVFSDYGIPRLEKLKTYILTIELPTITTPNSILKKVKFNIIPKDATFRIDNLSFELTNGSSEIPLSANQHTYTVSHKHFVTKTGTIFVSEQMTTDPITIKLEKAKGLLSVITTPTGADVYLNGTNIGKTPINTQKVETGNYQIDIVKSGYKKESSSIEIDEDEPLIINKNLSSIIDYQINTIPTNVGVMIDNQVQSGLTPITISKPSGTYNAKFYAKGYYDLNRKIVIDGTKNQETFRLKRIFFNKTGGYIDANMQIGTMMAAGISIGSYIYNVNIEVVGQYGLINSEEIFWNSTSSTESIRPSSYTYKPIYIGGKIGYGFHIGNRIQLTPQIGIGSVMISGIQKEQGESESDFKKTYVFKGTAGLRLNIAVINHFGISIAQNYSLPIKKGKIFEDMEQTSSKIKGWGTGFNCKIGINYFF